MLDFHRNKPTLNPIALGEFSGSGIGIAAKLVMNSIRSKRWRIVQSDCIKHFTPAFYAGILRRHFTPGILRRAFYTGVVRIPAGDVGETMEVVRVDKIVQDFVNWVES